MKNTSRNFACWLLSLPMIAAQAANGAADYCAQNPSACDAAQQRIEKRCAEDPSHCDQIKARVENFKRRCEADPTACEQKKEALRQRAEAQKAQCADDPTACAQHKQALRERFQQRHGDKRTSPAGETPPTIPPAPQE